MRKAMTTTMTTIQAQTKSHMSHVYLRHVIAVQ